MDFWTNNGEYYTLDTTSATWCSPNEDYYVMIEEYLVWPGPINWSESINVSNISWEKTKKKCIFDE